MGWQTPGCTRGTRQQHRHRERRSQRSPWLEQPTRRPRKWVQDGGSDPTGGLGNQLVKFNYRVRGGGPCRGTCERGWPKGRGSLHVDERTGELARGRGAREVKREEGFEWQAEKEKPPDAGLTLAYLTSNLTLSPPPPPLLCRPWLPHRIGEKPTRPGGEDRKIEIVPRPIYIGLSAYVCRRLLIFFFFLW